MVPVATRLASNLKIKATFKEFFDRKKVTDQLDKATERALGKAGKFVRQEAKRIIKPAQRATQKTLGQLTDKQRQRYEIAVAEAKEKGEPKPKLPRIKQHAAAGKPPISQTGLLKDHIYYSFDSAARAVVIGPAKLNSSEANLKSLEEGGDTIASYRRRRVTLKPHPFMGPALKKQAPTIANLFKDSINA